MECFIYKTEEEKEAINKTIIDIRKFIYHDDKVDYVSSVLVTLPYSFIQETENTKRDLNLYFDGMYDDETDRYFQCYDIEDDALSIGKKEQYIKAMMDNIVFFYSGGYDAPYVPILNDYIHNTLEYQYENKKGNLSVFGEIGHLGLLAFSNELDTNANNDLIRATLYNRHFLKERFDEIMGEGSFNELRDLCDTVSTSGIQNNGILYDKGVKYIIEMLKEYFYKRLETLDIPNEDKSIMKSRFDLEYTNVQTAQDESIRKTIRK